MDLRYPMQKILPHGPLSQYYSVYYYYSYSSITETSYFMDIYLSKWIKNNCIGHMDLFTIGKQ